jgi:hypothetical protein
MIPGDFNFPGIHRLVRTVISSQHFYSACTPSALLSSGGPIAWNIEQRRESGLDCSRFVPRRAGEAIKRKAGLGIIRVAHRSIPAAVTGLIAGHVPILIADLNNALPDVCSRGLSPL